MKIFPLSMIFFVAIITNSEASPWWKKNIDNYSYSKNLYGMRPTGVKIRFNCSLIDDSRHRILVDDDWSNKVKALGYNDAAYRVISISDIRVQDPSIPDGWYNGRCYGEILLRK